jgi:hypothetical protein
MQRGCIFPKLRALLLTQGKPCRCRDTTPSSAHLGRPAQATCLWLAPLHNQLPALYCFGGLQLRRVAAGVTRLGLPCTTAPPPLQATLATAQGASSRCRGIQQRQQLADAVGLELSADLVPSGSRGRKPQHSTRSRCTTRAPPAVPASRPQPLESEITIAMPRPTASDGAAAAAMPSGSKGKRKAAEEALVTGAVKPTAKKPAATATSASGLGGAVGKEHVALVDPRRVRTVKPGTVGNGPIIYWMSRCGGR